MTIDELGRIEMKIGQYDLGMNSLYKEMNDMKMQAGTPIANDLKIQRGVENPNSANFGDMLNQAINNVNDLGHASKDKAVAFEMGDKNVSLADVMIAKEKSGIAFEATMQVRNKVLEAYEKIMQMPV